MKTYQKYENHNIINNHKYSGFHTHEIYHALHHIKCFPGGSDGKESACNVGDLGSIPGSGRVLGEGNGNPLPYSCLENSMNRGTW